jgi:hypothetical protein
MILNIQNLQYIITSAQIVAILGFLEELILLINVLDAKYMIGTSRGKRCQLKNIPEVKLKY